jgi:predicted lactoylglutathione lyase
MPAMNFFATFPVSDLDRSRAFYTALGWTINEEMSDQNGFCIVVGEGVHLMAARRDFFGSLGDGTKETGDPATTSMVTFAFDFPTRDDVDAFLGKAESAGGKIHDTDDYGFMYQRPFEDPDGNQFAPFWMNPEEPPTE